MRRREFITLLGGAVAAWPLAARAQQPERVRRIGVLMPFAENDPDAMAQLSGFMEGLAHLGWTDGRNGSAKSPMSLFHASVVGGHYKLSPLW
jgi:putative ABC transport system substrate-binding protein